MSQDVLNRKIFLSPQSDSLFLDRDGVINRRIPGDYVKSWAEFEFLPGVPDAFRIFNRVFRHIIIVTNQQGVGKGLMQRETLEFIHQRMRSGIESSGGRIDGIYFCPDLAGTGSLCRKPSIGMALKARRDHPGLNLKKAVMVGDSLSDLQFGKRAGMRTVLIAGDPALARRYPNLCDLVFPGLLAFAENFTNP